MTKKTTDLLRAVPAFARLSDDQLGLLAASVGRQSFARGEVVFHQDLMRAGDFFGELALLDGLPRSASAQAMCATTTLTLHRAAFLHTINSCPPIAASILEVMAARLRHSTAYAEQLAGLTATQRVARQLLALALRYGVAEDGGTRIDLRLTQDDLASLSGTTRETVNRVLAALRDQGLVRAERAQVWVPSVAALRSAVATW
jgi:CRP/FNR family transcriptional regulator, cyclic AMP receptor protein